MAKRIKTHVKELDISGRAVISDNQMYRYRLDRVWDEDNPRRIMWIMLNPSTATATVDDATIRRCIGFSWLWHFGGLSVVNLYAFRATQPFDLWMGTREHNIVGPENDRWIIDTAKESHRIVCAWGTNADFRRPKDVKMLLDHRTLWCLGFTNNNRPPHPLRLRRDTPLVKLGEAF